MEPKGRHLTPQAVLDMVEGDQDVDGTLYRNAPVTDVAQALCGLDTDCGIPLEAVLHGPVEEKGAHRSPDEGERLYGLSPDGRVSVRELRPQGQELGRDPSLGKGHGVGFPGLGAEFLQGLAPGYACHPNTEA